VLAKLFFLGIEIRLTRCNASAIVEIRLDRGALIKGGEMPEVPQWVVAAVDHVLTVIAADIRNELVCSCIEAKDAPYPNGMHPICLGAENAARIVEDYKG
jgi:hypothetical protein